MISLVTQWYEKVMANKIVFLEYVETDKWEGNHVNGVGISLKKCPMFVLQRTTKFSIHYFM